ncbi:MAG: 1-acyl-sn-glycerol-3-phosphate acyltransferase [Bacteroidales bacterium]|nr:1-acyl-sn-glycerol-3-phosphate acyltransferase [Bacteroidales bacterium]
MSDNINQPQGSDKPVKRTVLDVEDVIEMVPKLKGHEKLVERVLHWLQVDRVNDVHSRGFDHPGPEFVKFLLDDFKIKLRIDNEQVLDNLPEGAFVTVSNHPFGALDGITLIHLVASRRPEYKVMVNMILNRLTAMRPNFIAVDQTASDDPAKKAVSIQGIKQAIMQVRRGKPMGFFPAGAVSKVNWRGELNDRQWQPSIIRLIEQLNVPVIPIYFHGSNSFLFNFLGVVCWQLRTLRLPSEVWRKCNTTLHISVGDPIPVEEQKRHQGSVEEFGEWLKSKTYEMRRWK